MIDKNKRLEKEMAKAKHRKRIHVEIDPDNYEYIPEVKPTDYYDNDVPQRVAIYVRVSTDDVRQTTSFELQKKYYEDFVVKHPHWTLVKIYADEGISGTSLAKREQFQQMISDAKQGKVDLIITKSVSRFARNVVDFIGIVRSLAERTPPVGVFFESEAIFSLNDNSQLALSFQATMAEEESHTRSRSMESSLRMRLDNGIPLTPKLLGYTHDADGGLVPNPDEAPTVKLAFYMYLYGYSTQQIANAFNALGRKSYLGNINWTSSGIVQILRNERHCGDVLTRKTYTPNYLDHKSKKNRGQRPQSKYRNHHTGIVTRDDYIAVQQMLDNAKYGNKSILPEIRVVNDGVLKGFVTINPRWSGFKEGDYYQASKSVYDALNEDPATEEVIDFSVEPGDFDLRGFEVARGEFFDNPRKPHAVIYHKFIKFSTACVRKFGNRNYIEILINPISRKIAIRPTNKENRNSVMFAKAEKGIMYPRIIPTAAFSETMFNLLGWNIENKYRILGSLYEQDDEIAYIFDTVDSEAYFKTNIISPELNQKNDLDVKPLMPLGKHIRAIPESWTSSFGKQFYAQEKSVVELQRQSEKDWMLRLEGQLFETGNRLKVTSFEELRNYINQELQGIEILEANHD